MRHFYDLPRDDGSRRIHRCPPSHHEMALPPHLAQAFAQAPRPSPPTTARTVSSVQAFPYYQRGSTMPLAVSPAPLALHSPHCSMPFMSMAWGGNVQCTRARSHDRSYGSSAPAPMSFGASIPTYSPHHLNIMGGGYSPTTQTSTPLVGVTPSCHPTAIVEWAGARASAEAVSEYAHKILAYWDAKNANPHERTVIGHGIGGILIPAKMVRLAKS